MSEQTTITAPVNPLTGELTTITIARRDVEGGKLDVQALRLNDGLAISPTPQEHAKHPVRYSLTHIPTGLAVIPSACGLHIQEAAERTLALGIDWTTVDRKNAFAVAKAGGFMEILSAVRLGCSARWCEKGDGPEPLSWGVTCHTCHWEWDEFDGRGEYEWPLTEEEARSLGEEHECEPEIEVQAPSSSTGNAQVTDHGPVKPPYGTPERTSYDAARQEAETAAPLSEQECSHRDDPGHDHEQCLEQHAANEAVDAR